MDPSDLGNAFVNRLVSGIKEKTVRIAEQRLGQALNVQETPQEAVLAFISSSVTSGAARLDVRVETNDLVLTHDGKMLHPTDIDSMLQGRANSLSDLARGLQLHLAEKGAKLELSFVSAQGMHQASLQHSTLPKIADADLNELKLSGMTTRVRLVGSGNYRRVNQALGNELPEIALIRRRCLFAPLEIVINGKALDRHAHLPLSLLTGEKFHRDPSLAVAAFPSFPGQGTLVDLSHVAPLLQSIQSGICGIARTSTEACWYQLKDGVARPMADIAWPSRTWGFVGFTDTGSGATETDINTLTAQMTRALFELVRKGELNGQDNIVEALSFLERQRATLLSLGSTAIDIDRTFLSLREATCPSSDPRVLNSRLELAGSLESQGEDQEASEHYAEILPVWENEALNHFDKYRFEEGATLWQKALALHEKIGTDPLTLAEKNLRLAEIGKEQRLGCAEPSYRRALSLLESSDQPDLPKRLRALLGLAEVLKRNRVVTDSLRYAEQAHRLQLELDGGNETKHLVPILKLQGELHDLLGDYVRSTDFEQKALLLKFRR